MKLQDSKAQNWGRAAFIGVLDPFSRGEGGKKYRIRHVLSLSVSSTMKTVWGVL